MPRVIVKASFDGREESLSEYLCDWPDCPNVAVHVVGVLRELRMPVVVCADHAAEIARRKRS